MTLLSQVALGSAVVSVVVLIGAYFLKNRLFPEDRQERVKRKD